MGIILMLVCLAYLAGAGIVLVITRKLTKSKKIFVLVAIVLVLFPFRRLIFYETLFAYYGRAPLQEIRETVEFPISVYWEDNVWPGFDEYGRHWMIKNYLDGDHLQALALNGDDGKIYLYRATKEDFAGRNPLVSQLTKLETEEGAMNEKFVEAYKKDFLATNSPLKSPEEMKKKEQFIRENPLHQELAKIRLQIQTLRETLGQINEQALQNILARSEVYADRNAVPAMHYRVEFNPLPKNLVLNNDFKMLHADRLSIIDTKTSQEIAFSQRYMAYAGFISQISGEQPRFTFKLGDVQVYEFDNRVLFGYVKAGGYDVARKIELNNRL